MNTKDLVKLCKRHGISQAGIEYILKICSTPPSRQPNKKFNVVDRFASRKNGHVINSESRNVEFAYVLWAEFNISVLEIYDQPPIEIEYLNASGKKRRNIITLDFLEISEDGVSLIECKRYSQLTKLAAKNPNRYHRTSSGEWTSPPITEALEQLGIKFRFVTEKDYSAIYKRNTNYFLNFIDDLNEDYDFQKIANELVGLHRMLLKDAFSKFGQACIISSIVKRKIYFDLQNELLLYPESAYIYADENAFYRLNSLSTPATLVEASSISELSNQKFIWWNGNKVEILSTSEESIIIDGGEIEYIPIADIEKAIDNKEMLIELVEVNDADKIESYLSKFKKSDIENAVSKKADLEIFNSGKKSVKSISTIKRWKKKMAEAKANLGDSLLGLIDQSFKKGNRKRRISDEHLNIIQETIKKEYLTPTGRSAKFCFDLYASACKKLNLSPLSLTSFYEEIKRTSKRKIVLAREGYKAAYALGVEPAEYDGKDDAPARGDYAFHLAHIDHTPIEMDFISEIDGKVISMRLLLTFLIDSYSNEILAFHVHFEDASYRSVMLVMRECYRRYKRLPIIVMCDGASEFKSTSIQVSAASLGITLRYRPTGKFRHGTIIERTFGTSQTELIHNLQGNRKLKKYGRGQSKTHDSEAFATWTATEFYEEFYRFCYEDYPNNERGGIRETPRNRFNRSIQSFDETPGVKVDSDLLADIQLLPTHPTEITMRNGVVEFKKITYLINKTITDYRYEKIKVKVKYDPYNASTIYVLLGNKFEKLITRDPVVQVFKDKKSLFGFHEISRFNKHHSRHYRSPNEERAKSYHRALEKEHELSSKANQGSQTFDRPKFDFNSVPLTKSVEIKKED